MRSRAPCSVSVTADMPAAFSNATVSAAAGAVGTKLTGSSAGTSADVASSQGGREAGAAWPFSEDGGLQSSAPATSHGGSDGASGSSAASSSAHSSQGGTSRVPSSASAAPCAAISVARSTGGTPASGSPEYTAKRSSS